MIVTIFRKEEIKKKKKNKKKLFFFSILFFFLILFFFSILFFNFNKKMFNFLFSFLGYVFSAPFVFFFVFHRDRGVILYGMMAGQLPFLSPRNDRTTVKEWRDRLMSQISRGITVTQEKKIAATSSGYKDLVKHLLQLQPHKRMPMWQIRRHPWINCRDKTTACNTVCPSNGTDRAELKAVSPHRKKKRFYVHFEKYFLFLFLAEFQESADSASSLIILRTR